MAFADTAVELGNSQRLTILPVSGDWRGYCRAMPRVSAFYGVVIYDPAYFSEVTVDPEAGTIVWPGGIDLAPEPLYEQAKAHPLLAA